jgi:hypothetical protein
VAEVADHQRARDGDEVAVREPPGAVVVVARPREDLVGIAIAPVFLGAAVRPCSAVASSRRSTGTLSHSRERVEIPIQPSRERRDT